MKTYATRNPFRQFTRDEVEAFLNGSTNPYLAPLVGREPELRAWLSEERETETQAEARVDVPVLGEVFA